MGITRVLIYFYWGSTDKYNERHAHDHLINSLTYPRITEAIDQFIVITYTLFYTRECGGRISIKSIILQ